MNTQWNNKRFIVIDLLSDYSYRTTPVEGDCSEMGPNDTPEAKAIRLALLQRISDWLGANPDAIVGPPTPESIMMIYQVVLTEQEWQAAWDARDAALKDGGQRHD